MANQTNARFFGLAAVAAIKKERTTMTELLPCPFCGGAAQAEHFESKLGRWRWSIGCNDHTSEADDGGEPAAECYGFQSMTSFATKAEAIAAWNRRASHSLASASGGEDSPAGILDVQRMLTIHQSKGGDANARSDDSQSKPTLHATSPRVTAGASAVEDDLCKPPEIYRSLSAQLSEARRENDAYREAFGCLACGEYHPVESMCPPHEVRSSGMESHRQQIGKAVARATAAESEAAALRKRVGEADRLLIKCFNRIHTLPRTSDTELADAISNFRARTALEGRE